MFDEFCDLLRRETAAATTLEGRIRALELLAAADEQRFLQLAVDEMETATEQLAALELSRVLTLAAAGMSPDVTASDLIERVEDLEDARHLEAVVAGLGAAMERVVDARARAQVVIANGDQRTRERMHAVQEFALH